METNIIDYQKEVKMKRLGVLFFTGVFILSLSAIANAASIGGAETQGKGKLGMGFDFSYLNRDINFKSADNLPANYSYKDVEIDRGYQGFIKTSYGVLDNLDIYVKLGVANYKDKLKQYDGNAEYADIVVNSQTGFAYGFGIKGTYELKDNWLVGCDMQYLTSKQEQKTRCTLVSSGEEISAKYKKQIMSEWHVSPYVAKRLGKFVPYLGVSYSDFLEKEKKPTIDSWADNVKYKAKYNVGTFVGIDFKMSDKWKLNLEGRFIDETAVSTAATYKF
jgi:outer membrane protein W